MPELPEVEHARRMLVKWLGRARIDAVFVQDARILDAGVRPARVVRALKGRRVEAIERRGKWLRITLDDRSRLFSHLGMTGKWVSARISDDAVPFEKVRLDVTTARAKRSVRYVDPRLFGRFVVVAEKVEDPTGWRSLGPDPLHDGIDVTALAAKLGRRKLPIKPTLLEQSVLAGVGNIQATEALFFARIDPRRPSNELARAEVTKLAREIARSIARTLALQEGPVLTYVEESGAANPFRIYGREGTPCPRCKRPLAKMILAGRGTVFCAHCQT